MVAHTLLPVNLLVLLNSVATILVTDVFKFEFPNKNVFLNYFLLAIWPYRFLYY